MPLLKTKSKKKWNQVFISSDGIERPGKSDSEDVHGWKYFRSISESDCEIEASKTDVCCTLCSSTIRSYPDYYIQNKLGIVS